MASSYTALLNLEKPATGEQEDTWGETLNANLDLIDAQFGKVPELLNTKIVTGTPTALEWATAGWFDGTYRKLELHLHNLAVSADDGVDLFYRVASSYLGSGYAGAGSYTAGGSSTNAFSTTTARILLTGATALGADGGEELSGIVRIFSPGLVGVQKRTRYQSDYANASGVQITEDGTYSNSNTDALDGLKLQVVTTASVTFVNDRVVQLWGYR